MKKPSFALLCRDGTLDAIKNAVNAGANVNSITTPHGKSALMFAARDNKNPNVISFLLDTGADYDAVDNMGMSALMYAASSNENPNVISHLLKAGADVNTVDGNGWSALMHAANMRTYIQNTEEVIIALINADADTTIKDYINNSAADIAKKKGHKDEILRMLEIPATPTAISDTAISSSLSSYATSVTVAGPDFLQLCRDGTPKEIEQAINSGADVNAVDSDGTPALMLAIEDNNNPSVISLLLEAGANVNAREYNGYSALIYALEKNNQEVISLLLEAGADINAFYIDGFTALMHAIRKNNPKVISVLLEAGANVNAVNGHGHTMLILAVTNSNNPEVISLLLKAGANVNAVNSDGYTPLMCAVAKDNPEVISLLLKAGANVNAVTSNGHTALMYAVAININSEVISLLLETGADITLKNCNNDTAFDIARKREGVEDKEGWEKVLRMLEVPITPTAISSKTISSSSSASDTDAYVDDQTNEEHIKTMKTLVTKFGPDIYIDSKRFSGLISDYFTSDIRMKKILLIAVQDGVSAEIYAIRGSKPENFQFEISRILKKFIYENVIVESFGRSVINCLAGGLLDIKPRS